MAPNQVEASETHSPQINSINRVAELPVVKSAIDIAYDRYEKLKGYNAVVGSSLSKAEQTAKYVADSAMPVVAKLEKQRKLLIIVLKVRNANVLFHSRSFSVFR